MPNSTFLAAHLVSKNQLTIDAIECQFELENPTNWNHLPGQYIWLILPKLKLADTRGNRRAFSLTSAAGSSSLSIITRVTTSGYKQTLRDLPIGSPVQVIGPRGSSFVLLPELSQGHNVVMIGGGVGVSPFLGNLRSLSQPVVGQALSLLQYTSTDQACNVAEITALSEKYQINYQHFSGHFSLDHISLALHNQNSVFAISGSQPMVDEAAKLLLDGGVNRNQLRFEQLYPSFEVQPWRPHF